MKRGSKEIEFELAKLEVERDLLQDQIDAIESSLKIAKSRMVYLCGASYSSCDRGQIARLRNDLEAARLRESDESAMKVRVRPAWSKEYGSNYALRKVTKKLIFLASPGCQRSDRYGRDGSSSYGTIHPEDLAKILEVYG